MDERFFKWIGWDKNRPHKRMKGWVCSYKYPWVCAWAKDPAIPPTPEALYQQYDEESQAYVSIIPVKYEYINEWIEYRDFCQRAIKNNEFEKYDILESENICAEYYELFVNININDDI